MGLGHLLEKKDNRILLGSVVGVPVTLITVPFILLGLVTAGGLPSTEPFSSSFWLIVLVVLLSTLGLVGLAGAWTRMFQTSSSLAARPYVRKAIAVSLGLGIVASGGFALVMLFAVKLWPVALLLVGFAVIGWLLLEASCGTET